MEAPPPASVEASGWGWRHAGRRGWALRGLDLRIEAGERVLLLAPSGAGKSTLLAALAGILDPGLGGEGEGSLRIDGRVPAALRDRVGILFQDPESQLVMARCGDDVAFGLENRCVAPSAIWPRVAAALEAVGFRYPLAHPTNALSGGEKQRLALAGTLALRPGLLLLDEPTANLDPEGAAAIRDVLWEVLERTGATMVLVEHRIDAALPLVDRVVVLEAGGGVVADGAPGAVFAAHGERLAAQGVWIPDRPITAPPRRPAEAPPREAIVGARLRFRYPQATVEAVSDLDVTVCDGQALAVTGGNGSGKSTLALLLAGLLRPSAGTVLAGPGLPPERTDQEIWRWPAGELVARIGTVFQDPEHQFLERGVADELMLGPLRTGAGEAEARRRADELMTRLHLAHLADANPFTLSGGEKRRLSVATALATAPRVLILDEPTFGQDRRTSSELLALLGALRDAGHAIGFVSHDRPFVEALADREIRMAGGRQVAV